MSTYRGQPVKIVRVAQQGDPGFDAAQKQVIIQNADGSQSTVLRTDVHD